MSSRPDLSRAAALLAAAMSSGAILSACAKESAPPPAKAEAPLAPSAESSTDVAALRRAAALISEWNKRDPKQTAEVMKEHGLGVVDEATLAAIAAKDQPGAAATTTATAANEEPPKAPAAKTPAPNKKAAVPMA